MEIGNSHKNFAIAVAESRDFARMHISASSYHTSGANACMGDGSVRFVRDSVSLPVWLAAGTVSGGEVTNLD